MRYFTLVLATLAAFTPSALRAADLPVKQAASAPNWSGIYAGLNAGFGWSHANWRNTASAPAATFFDYVPGEGFSSKLSGVLGGAHLGVNYQSGAWVYGAEAAISGGSINGAFTSMTGAADDRFRARLDALFLATGRIGFTWSDYLAYGKAGIAAARVHLSVSDTLPPTTGSGSDTQWRFGPAVGLGLEHRLTPHLSIAAEYDYVHLGDGTYQLGGAAGDYSWKVDLPDLHLLMVRLNYRFAGL